MMTAAKIRLKVNRDSIKTASSKVPLLSIMTHERILGEPWTLVKVNISLPPFDCPLVDHVRVTVTSKKNGCISTKTRLAD
jgi:hypothetical protein